MTPRALRIEKRIKIAILLLALVALGVTGARAYGATSRCQSVSCYRAAIDWHRKHEADLARQLNAHWEPTRERLICPIATALGISCAEARAVNKCESDTEDAVANSSQHVGWYQESSTFMSDNHLPWTNAQRWDKVINVLAALLVVKREGWGQWTCRRVLG